MTLLCGQISYPLITYNKFVCALVAISDVIDQKSNYLGQPLRQPVLSALKDILLNVKIPTHPTLEITPNFVKKSPPTHPFVKAPKTSSIPLFPGKTR